jgi:hypothetical protein
MATKPIEVARVKELLNYDPETGALRWKPRTGRNGSWCNLDRDAGSKSKQTGYLTIRLDKKLYQAHRLAWAIHYGVSPDEQIDHINGDRLDNRIQNLRLLTSKGNAENHKRARVDSRTRVQGVSLTRKPGVFKAKIKCNGQSRHLGHFSSIEAARSAYLSAKLSLHQSYVPPTSSLSA